MNFSLEKLLFDMRVLVQDCDSHRFLKEDDHWTENPAEAMDFPSSFEAMNFCVHNRIQKAEVVLKAQDERYDVHLALSRDN